MKGQSRFGGGIGRFARKLIPSRKKRQPWWEVPLAEDELEQPFTPTYRGGFGPIEQSEPQDRPFDLSGQQGEPAPFVEEEERYQPSRSSQADDAAFEPDADQDEDRPFEFDDDILEDEAQPQHVGAEEDAAQEAVPTPVLASSADRPRLLSRVFGALRIKSIRSRKRGPGRVSQFFAVAGSRIRRARLHVLAFALRRPELLEEDPRRAYRPPKEIVEDVHAEWTSLITRPRKERWWTFRRLKQAIGSLLVRKTVALTVEKGVVRIVVFRGKEAIAWGSAVPEGVEEQGQQQSVPSESRSEATTNAEGSTEGEEGGEKPAHTTHQEVGSLRDSDGPRLRALLKDLGFRRTRFVTELPLYTPLLRFMQIPKIRGRFLRDVIVSELEDTLPFTKGEVDIKWQTRQGERGAEVLAIAAQSRLIDDHARILKTAQIQPLASYTRAVSLAYASGIPNAIVVHLTNEEAGIVLIRDGVPRVVHRLELTEHNGDKREQAQAIAKAVEHVDDYYHSIELRDAQASFAVVLTGDQLDTDSSLITAFEEVSSHQVRPFKPPVVYPQNLPACEYAANIGLAIADRSRARFGGKLVKAKGPSVNMLSRRHLPKPLPLMQAAIVAMLILFGAAAFNFTTQVDSRTLEAATLTNQIESLERQARQQRLSTGRISSLQGRIETADTLTTGLNTQLTALRVELEASISRMEAMTRDGLPQGVALSNLVIQGTDITLSGSGPSYESVTQYTSNLRAFGPRHFTSVKILRVEASSSFGVERVSFQIKAVAPPGVTTGTESEGEDTPGLQDLLDGLQGEGGDEPLEGLGGLEGLEGSGEEGLGGLNPGQ